MALCLSIDAIAMFAILKTQVWNHRLFSGARGIGLIVPSILLATVVMVISNGIQICTEAVCWTTGHFISNPVATLWDREIMTDRGRHTIPHAQIRLITP